MNVIEAVNNRKSIRAFKPDAIPQEILRNIMELALRAPSWANTQPWEFSIVSGEKLEEIKQAFVEKAEEQPKLDLLPPREFLEPYDIRRRAIGRKVFEIKGIGREDREKRKWWELQGLRLFGAPCAIYIYVDRSFHFQGGGINIWPIFDCGIIAESIMLLATQYGLGTITQRQAVNYPDVLRRILGIPNSKLVVIGMAIGYTDRGDPINQFRSEREPLDNVVKWHGFEYESR